VGFKITRIAALVSFSDTGNLNLHMMLNMQNQKIKIAYGLLKDTKALHIRVGKSYNSPIKESYSGYTVFPGIAIPFPPSS
jgi:hypothetical protein